MPRTESAVLGGLPFTSADYCDFRTHGPHMRIDDLSAPSGRFVARVSASVATVDRCPGRGRTLAAADNDSLRSSPYPPRSARAPQKPLLPRRPSPSRLLHVVSTASAPALSGSPMPPTVKPSLDRISTRTRRRTATAASAAPPYVDYGFGPGGAPRPFARRANTPPRVPPAAAGSAHRRDLCSCRLVGPDGANTVRPRPRRACGNSSLTSYAPSWRHTACTCQVGCPWRRC